MAEKRFDHRFDLSKYGLNVMNAFRNVSVGRLYEDAYTGGGASITATGALAITSGNKTGRSPRDKRIVEHADSRDDVWWGEVNAPISEHAFLTNRQRALDYLNTREHLFVLDGFAGAHSDYRIKVRVICESAYHALFMHNMLIRPTPDELEDFGEPDYVIFNAGKFPACPLIPQVSSETSVCLSFERREIVILGTEYAGEMKKGVFTIMNYLMPKRGVLSMHCSVNEGDRGDVAVFFGLSGTGKTTLSADANRKLIGDDEHCWTDEGVFNIEGGCYAKVVHLSEEREPEIYRAIRFGTVLENVVYSPFDRVVDYEDTSITENTRASYPVTRIENAKIPGIAAHPSNVIFLTCDAFGVLPPVSRLTPEQAMYHFISGYTAKVAGTEMGITEPQATFSACYGAAFLVWHPAKYAELLAKKMSQHNTRVWLVNTGWSGGAFGNADRMELAHTRAIVDAIHGGQLADVPTVEDPVFGLQIPTTCPGIPENLLLPRNAWADKAAYDTGATRLAGLFQENFRQFSGQVSADVLAGGPRS